MKSVTKISLLLSLILFLSTSAFAQNRPENGTIGLSASIQNGQTNLELPIWASQNIVIAPVVGISYQEDNYTSINLGIAPRFYQRMSDNFASYVGARGLLERTSPNVGPEDTDFLLGATGGGEYFLSNNFSLGVEGQLNYLFNDNGGNTFTTGAAVIGSVYF